MGVGPPIVGVGCVAIFGKDHAPAINLKRDGDSKKGHHALGDPLVTLDLAAMHDAPRFGVKRITPVQHRKIIPH